MYVTHLMIPLNIRGIIGNSIRNPKIDQLQLATNQHEIRRFEIRMYDLLFVYDMHGL
jgi:hypothetical protein